MRAVADVALLVVRHTDAGDRSVWAGDDRLRPLSPLGEAQASALVDVHADRPIARVVTSPYVRCVQSVKPLARARGLVVEEDDAVAEGAAFDAIDRCLQTMSATDAVVCSHGDVLDAILAELQRRGVDLRPRPACPKGSTWVLDRWPDTTAATYVDRPAL